MSHFLKIYCHLRSGEATSTAGPFECSEVSIQASPAVLRRLADFLERASRALPPSADAFGHVHLRDEWREWEADFPDVVAVSPPAQNG